MGKHLLVLALMCLGCTTIRPGEVGVAQSFGRLSDDVRGPGLVVHSPIGRSYVRVPVRTTNIEVKLDLPSKEGLNVRSEISILYRIEPGSARKILEEIGRDPEGSLVLPVFRSSVADVSSRFYAKDMHSGERSVIEESIRERMSAILAPRGIVVEAVLLKSITLPPGLYAAVETKLAAEQSAQQMEFVLQRERSEGERKVIVATAEAEAQRISAAAHRDVQTIQAAGVAEANKLAAQGLTPLVIQWRSIEAFEALAESPAAKVIVTDGQAPLMISP